MPADRIAEIRQRLGAAGPGPWTGDRIDGTIKYDLLDANGSTVVHGCNGNEDPAFGIYGDGNDALILHAPEDLAFLLDEVDRITETCAALRALLAEARVSVEGDEWSAPVDLLDRIDAALAADHGAVARLEGYDALRARVVALEEDRDRLRALLVRVSEAWDRAYHDGGLAADREHDAAHAAIRAALTPTEDKP